MNYTNKICSIVDSINNNDYTTFKTLLLKYDRLKKTTIDYKYGFYSLYYLTIDNQYIIDLVNNKWLPLNNLYYNILYVLESYRILSITEYTINTKKYTIEFFLFKMNNLIKTLNKQNKTVYENIFDMIINYNYQYRFKLIEHIILQSKDVFLKVYAIKKVSFVRE